MHISVVEIVTLFFFSSRAHSHFPEIIFFNFTISADVGFFSVFTSAQRNWNTFCHKVIHSRCICSSLINLKISDLKLSIWEENERLKGRKKKIFNYRRNKRQKPHPPPHPPRQSNRWSEMFLKKWYKIACL